MHAANASNASKAVFFTLIVSSLMIPVHVTLVPRFILVSEIGLVNNPLGVILPQVADLRRVEERLMLFFWHVADRWGRVGPEGVTVPLPVTPPPSGSPPAAQSFR